MSLTLTIGPSFEFALSRSSLYLEAFGFCLGVFTSEDFVASPSWWQVEKWFMGSGWRVVLGLLCVEFGRT